MSEKQSLLVKIYRGTRWTSRQLQTTAHGPYPIRFDCGWSTNRNQSVPSHANHCDSGRLVGTLEPLELLDGLISGFGLCVHASKRLDQGGAC
jgi:hypothetical protein